MTKTTKTDLFDSIIVGRDLFRSRIDEISKLHKDSIDRAERDFKGNRLAIERKKIDDKFVQARIEAIEEVSEVLDKIKEERQRIYADVQAVNSPMSLFVNNLPDTVTETEFVILCEKYANSNYWTDRRLESLADRCGIAFESEKVGIRSNADKRLHVLDILEHDFNEDLDKYGFETTDKEDFDTIARLHDTKLFRLEREFTDNFTFANYDAQTLASRMITNVKMGGDKFSTSIRFANAVKRLEENNPEALERFLFNCSKDNRIMESGCIGMLSPENREKLSAYASGKKKPFTTEADSLELQIKSLTKQQVYDAEGLARLHGHDCITQEEINFVTSNDYSRMAKERSEAHIAKKEQADKVRRVKQATSEVLNNE